MTVEHSALAGLDEVAWDSLEHAYGPATDVPELLRALVSGDEEQAAEAVYELYGTIWHQGSVYPATIPAVPFLVRIAVSGAAGAQTPELLGLLADIASSSDPRGVEDRDAVRSAVGAHTETIAGLLEHPDAPTRAAALFVLVHASSPSRIRPLILQRWDAETEALPRAEVLRAMMRVDSETAAVLAGGVLSAGASGDLPGDAVLRLSAALAWIRAGRAMDERVRDAALNGERGAVRPVHHRAGRASGHAFRDRTAGRGAGSLTRSADRGRRAVRVDRQIPDCELSQRTSVAG